VLITDRIAHRHEETNTAGGELVETKTRDWLKVTEVAQELGIPRSRAYELIGRGEIPAVRVGQKSIRVHRGELERFLMEKCRVVTS
jgi:excisionase family DNA binding protein